MAINCSPSSLANAARCFKSCLPQGGVQAVKTYLLCQNANAGKMGGGGVTPSLLTGFAFDPQSQPNAGQIQASWDALPAGATATELWTSSDNITYALAATVAAPFTATLVAGAAVGSFKWGKARWINVTAQGPFCAASEVSGRVCDWCLRAFNNGAAAMTLTERRAANAFDLALVAAAIDTLMQSNILVISSSVIGALTPLYHRVGVDPYTNGGPFVIGDLTINGLIGDGAGKGAGTGVAAGGVWASINDCGVTIYYFTGNVNAEQECGAFIAVGQCMQAGASFSGNATFNDYNQTVGQGQIVVAAAAFTGYFSCNRTGAGAQAMYTARSNLAHAAIQTGAGSGGILPTGNIPFWQVNNNGGAALVSTKRLSYCAIHNGMTQAQSLSHFNAVQAFRVALGGGSV